MTLLVYKEYNDKEPTQLLIPDDLEKWEIKTEINKHIKDWLCYEKI
jgi:hypothetical protein